MPTQNADPIDIIGFVVAVVTYIANKEIAEIIGPYIALAMISTMAAGWALSRAGEMTGIQSIRFLVLRAGTAIVFSVSLAQALHLVLPWALPRYTAIPIAFLLGLVKDLDELKEYCGIVKAFFKGKPDA